MGQSRGLWLWFFGPAFVGFVLYERRLAILHYFGGELGAGAVASRRTLCRLFEVVALLGLCASLVLFVIGGLLRAVSGPANPSSLALAAGFAGFSVMLSLSLCAEHFNGWTAERAAAYRLDGTFYIPRLYLAAFSSLGLCFRK